MTSVGFFGPSARVELELRKELSDAHKITRKFGMDELVWNHLSVRLPGGGYIITPGKRFFDDISPDDLVSSSSNVTADIIHAAIYDNRDDVHAVIHLHTPATVAVSCLAEGFIPLAQEAAYFYDKVCMHKWEGISTDISEQDRIGNVVKDRSFNTLLMENHGFCTMGATIGEAWVLAYYFDKACRTQLECMQTGAKLLIPDASIMQHACEQSLRFAPGDYEWDALRQLVR